MPEPDDVAQDRTYMRRALALARRGWGWTAPNPMVGAVVVRDGAVLGEGWHRAWGQPHAEVEALREAGDRARGATIYVTLEPCNHSGKQPPCVDALIAARVARVVCATRDPNPVAAGGAERLRTAGVAVEFGVEEEAARELNAPFFHAATGRASRLARPWVTLKLALSLDGAIADHTRRQAWLTGPEARRAVHRIRAGHDAVAVGIGTALADDPALTVRAGRAPRVPPLRVVFDRRLRLPDDSLLARTARDVPVLVLAGGDAPAEREAALRAGGVAVVRVADTPAALAHLAARGVRSLLVEGGAGLAGSLLGSLAVDRLVIFQAPVLLGAGALPAFSGVSAAVAAQAARWRPIARRAFGPDLMTVYAPEAADGVHRAD
jgi:diaminohydroxyphosphoribosylaminopyrimidine deaminase / 5-amino-6-(5-phosphoribosylamino)uracil reductase